jgi:hypothetical protein
MPVVTPSRPLVYEDAFLGKRPDLAIWQTIGGSPDARRPNPTGLKLRGNLCHRVYGNSSQKLNNIS